MIDKDLSDFLKDVEARPILRELDEAGYSYVANTDDGYWIMRHTEEKPVIYYDWQNDIALPMLIVEQQETYMNN